MKLWQKKVFGIASAEAAHEALHTAMPNDPLIWAAPAYMKQNEHFQPKLVLFSSRKCLDFDTVAHSLLFDN